MKGFPLPRGGFDPYNTVDAYLVARAAMLRKWARNILYGKFITTRQPMKKRDELEQPNSCINKAEADEPVFVLRGKDPLAASAVEYWVRQAEQTGFHEPHKCAEARHLASEMRLWREKHVMANRSTAQADAANRADPDRIAESRSTYGLDQAATMEAIRLREERKAYKMSAAMMAGGTVLATLARENEGEPLSDKQLRDAAINASKFAEFLAVEMLDKHTA